MSVINVLPKSIADLIAAGEVVEQPSSVVKELLENSVDAGATVITLEINNGGKTYIRVTDNGCGIARDDIRKAFLSHATSKIEKAQDLDYISTLGFRGEALSSVCAVSKVDILTRTKSEDVGTHYIIEGGEEIFLDDAGCPVGTTVSVRDLFYNVPARMKFLKKDISEGNYVASVAQRLALSHPEISVRLIRDGKSAFRTPGDGKLGTVLSSLFGRDFYDGLVEIDHSYNGITVKGYASLPHNGRGSRSMQYFFINGRVVKSPVIMAALEQAYKNSITVGKFPAAALFIGMPFDSVDVNVHPAKTEVRFQDEKRVFDCVYSGVRNAVITGEPVRPSFSAAGIYINPVYSEQQITLNNRQFTVKHCNPPATEENVFRNPEPLKKLDFLSDNDTSLPEKPVCRPVDPSDVEELSEKAPVYTESAMQAANFSEELADLKILGEVYGVYVIIKYDGKLYIADKHAAHERIIFNKLKEKSSAVSQMMLQSVSVKLSAEEYAAIIENLTLLYDAGYDITDFGDMCVSVKACPVTLCSEDTESVITEIASRLATGAKEPVPDKLDWIYHSTACRAAVKAGDSLTSQELRELMLKVFSDSKVRYCPHGRPVLLEITEKELEKLFMRAQ